MQQRGPQEDKTENTGAGEGRRPHVSLAGRKIPIPRSRLARISTGSIFIVLGIFGFLPILGFWMVPVGLIILSYDVPAARRLRRRLEVWWHRRWKQKRGGRSKES